jgi:hypothetical protein
MWKVLQAKRIGGAPTSTVLSGRHLFARRRGTYRVSANSGRQGVSRDEMKDVFFDDTSNLESDAREEITFTGWLTDMILRGVFEPLDEYAE